MSRFLLACALGTALVSCRRNAGPGRDGSPQLPPEEEPAVAAPVATALVLLESASASVQAGELWPAFSVQAVDTSGRVVSYAGEVELVVEPPGRVLVGATKVSLVDGVARFTEVSCERALELAFGVVDVAGQLAPIGGIHVRVVAGPPSVVSWLVQPIDTVAGVALSPRPAVELRDAYGNMASTTDGAVSLGRFGITQSVHDGIAKFELRLEQAGAQRLLAFVSELEPTESDEFTVLAAEPARLAWRFPAEAWPAELSLRAGDTWPELAVRIEDRFGNLTDSDLPVQMSLSEAPLLGDAESEASGGVASFSNLATERAGALTLQAQTQGLEPITHELVIAAAEPDHLVLSLSPASVLAESCVDVTVTLVDRFLNSVSGHGETVQLRFGGADPRDTVAAGQVFSTGAVAQLLIPNGVCAFGSGRFAVEANVVGTTWSGRALLDVIPLPDTQGPVLTQVSIAPNPARDGTSVQLVFTASEPLSLGSVAIAERAAECATVGRQTTCTFVAQRSMDPEGLIPVHIAARDLAGNETAITRDVVFDFMEPRCVATALPEPAFDGFLIELTVTCNEALSEFPTVSVEAIDASFARLDGQRFVYTYLVRENPNTDATHPIVVRAVDRAGNVTSAEAGAVTFDFTAPVLPSLAVSPNPANRAATVSISFRADEPLNGLPVVSVGDNPAACTEDPSETFLCTYVVSADDVEGARPITVDVTYASGQVATYPASVWFDFTAPAFSRGPRLQSDILRPGDIARLTLTVDEALSQAPTASLGGIAFVLRSTNGLTYELEASLPAELAEGNYDLTVRISDRAGNDSEARLVVEVDGTGPMVVDFQLSPGEPRRDDVLCMTFNVVDTRDALPEVVSVVVNGASVSPPAPGCVGAHAYSYLVQSPAPETLLVEVQVRDEARNEATYLYGTDVCFWYQPDEICDGTLDNTCDGVVDEGCSDPGGAIDVDGDGFSPNQGDCDDGNPFVRPDASEACDGIDNNCTGGIDEGLPNDAQGRCIPCQAPVMLGANGIYVADTRNVADLGDTASNCFRTQAALAFQIPAGLPAGRLVYLDTLDSAVEDTWIQVRQGDCSGTFTICSDDACGGTQSQVLFRTTGVAYTVLVDTTVPADRGPVALRYEVATDCTDGRSILSSPVTGRITFGAGSADAQWGLHSSCGTMYDTRRIGTPRTHPFASCGRERIVSTALNGGCYDQVLAVRKETCTGNDPLAVANRNTMEAGCPGAWAVSETLILDGLAPGVHFATIHSDNWGTGGASDNYQLTLTPMAAGTLSAVCEP